MADKVITIKTITLAEFPQITVFNVAGVLTMTGRYQMVTTSGTAIDREKTVNKTLTVAQKNALIDFIVNNVGLVLAANNQEGM